MNILLEIADRDIIVIGLVLVAILMFGMIIFTILNRGSKEEEEVIEDKKNSKLNEEQIKAKEELERVFNQMSADLEEKNTAPEIIDDFEREQEENAIISYQELIKQVETKKQNDILKEELDAEDNKKFKNSEIISPIFGIQKNHEYVMPKSEEKPVSASHAYEEIKTNYKQDNNKEFLNSLKAFRKNL